MKACPCGTGREYEDCCAPYISGKSFAPTAEALMRSRYTAYVEHAIDYIIETCVEEGHEKIDPKSTREWSEKSKWLGLSITSIEGGGEGDTEGFVSFEAVYERNGLRDVHKERARFIKKEGRWFYDEGQVSPVTIVRSERRVGRNEACPCGSGKKYKHCCGK